MNNKTIRRYTLLIPKRLPMQEWTCGLLLALLCWLPAPSRAQQQGDSIRTFTVEQPLVYEDAWDLWPYAFLNENGEAAGYNIDLLKMIFKELDIPYIIKLKPTSDALNDLKEGQSDLMCGMDAYFNKEYAQYGKQVIQIFTHSVVHKKGEPAGISSINDLSSNRVIVHTGSFSHHLMIQRGWSRNAIPHDDMKEAIQKAHQTADTRILWNTLSLKYLIHQFHYDDLQLTPVNIQHGEYKFMSNNPRLLQQLDSVYAQLNSKGQLQAIQNKWFYPERKDSGIPLWIWQAIIVTLVLSIIITGYYAIYRKRERQMTKALHSYNRRLALVLRTSHVRIWLYDVIKKNVITFHQDGSHKVQSLSSHAGSYHIQQHDFEHVLQAMRQIIRKEQETATLQVKATQDNSNNLRNITIDIAVLRRNKAGLPTMLIGTSSDVTDELLRLIQVKDMMMRYQAIFNAAMVDTVAYDEHGIITDMNTKAASVFTGGKEQVVSRQITLQSVLGDDDIDLEHLEPTRLTQVYKAGDSGDTRILNKLLQRKELYYELQIMPVRNALGKLLGIFGTGRNVTEVVNSYSKLRQKMRQLEQANEEIEAYIRNIDFVLKNGGVRMADYSPDTHLLIIYNGVGQQQYRMTQTRALSLIDESSKRDTQRILNNMDNRSLNTQKAAIKTLLRTKDGQRLTLYFSFVPTTTADGTVTGYFGMCRDISEIKATEELLEQETQKAKEVENIKNAFLRNMSYEIRTPLNSVVGFAELFQMEHAPEDEAFFINEIKTNSNYLLRLINDILFLSRLDAHMIEFKTDPIDFSTIFESRCQTAWFNHQQPGVTYTADNPYNRLVIDIDQQNLGIVIDQIVVNAAQHTTAGYVRCRYDYTGNDLVMVFSDTGCGISEEKQRHIFERFTTSTSNGTGLGLSICNEIVRQMGGKITIKSEPGNGTIIWVTIPCKCTDIKRKTLNVEH